MRGTASTLLLATTSLLLVGACGPPEEHARPDERIDATEQFLVWDPGTSLDQQHVDWHARPCTANGQPGTGQVGVGRRCTLRGEDFLIWHRNYIKRLRDEYERQGLTGDVTAWLSLPAAMKDPANGWNANLQAAENNIRSMINPSTGARFATLDAFGRYLETFYHNALHGIAVRAYGESIVGGFMSPRSTYFLKIHGLVELHLQRFLAGDFNWDGKSDLLVRNATTGANRVLLMNGDTVLETRQLASGPDDTCGAYVGATADLDFDGRLDVVWHGPGCSSAYVWIMNGTTFVRSDALPEMGAGWTLIGSRDFNQDMRPDLAWVNDASGDVTVWIMNGVTRLGTLSVDTPAGWTPVLLGDPQDDGQPRLTLRRPTTEGGVEYAVAVVSTSGAVGAVVPLSGLSAAASDAPVATGRYRNAGEAADFVMFRAAESSAAPGRALALRGAASTTSIAYTTSALVPMDVGDAVVGPK
jgi:hypothetical protein